MTEKKDDDASGDNHTKYDLRKRQEPAGMDVDDASSTAAHILRLPMELRTQILGYLFGGQMIHIRYLGEEGVAKLTQGGGSTYNSFDHCVCQCATSEEDIYRNFTEHEPPDVDVPFLRNPLNRPWSEELHDRRFEYRHDNCWLFSPLQLDLAILRTCKQLQAEAEHIFWNTSTFSFARAECFQAFVKRMKLSHYATKVRKIHVNQMWYGSKSFKEWTQLLTPSFLESISGVHTFYVTCDEAPHVVGRITTPTLDMELDSPIAKMGMLDLKHITCVVADTGVENLAERRVVAEVVRNRLFAPTDPKILEGREVVKCWAEKAR